MEGPCSGSCSEWQCVWRFWNVEGAGYGTEPCPAPRLVCLVISCNQKNVMVSQELIESSQWKLQLYVCTLSSTWTRWNWSINLSSSQVKPPFPDAASAEARPANIAIHAPRKILRCTGLDIIIKSWNVFTSTVNRKQWSQPSQSFLERRTYVRVEKNST